MATITIEGSILPSAHLARGERQTVNDDDPLVQALIAGGYVVVVSEAPVAAELPTTLPDYDPTEVPKRNASRDDWAEFLAQHPGGFITEGKDRDQLMDEWDAFNAVPPAS